MKRMLKEALAKVVAGEDLPAEEARAVMGEIMEGAATPAQIGAFLVALRMKGETAPEVAGFARAMREKAVGYRSRHPLLVDTCGTGGDGAHTFNISTTAAFVVAACGCPVAKHGNRSVSSRAGSADLLEALGAKIDLPPAVAGQCLDTVGFGFFFAPLCHPAMKHAAGPRRELGLRTVFNILGPLCNPAGAQAQVVGVYAPELVDLVAAVLSLLGVKRAFVVHGAGGLDEVSPVGEVLYAEVADGAVRRGVLDPIEYGVVRCQRAALKGGTAAENAAITRGILQGEAGPRSDAVALNAALALVAAERAQDVREGLGLARAALASGAALAKMEEYVAWTRSVG
ncbi:anthranilate phosphoribosyltransferase [Thermodesulfitimonas autotrophica]|uniref:Anthranilate phosphoribosyltransferase n=2 Tax=Thermodesulfitimonas autotrophica TaxID=1894989 RepID=A0A3N5B2S4_9THEO|nr:anthranilate phosphoribosyltransferase [Thermodesulfitimonas autotrophica]